MGCQVKVGAHALPPSHLRGLDANGGQTDLAGSYLFSPVVVRLAPLKTHAFNVQDFHFLLQDPQTLELIFKSREA